MSTDTKGHNPGSLDKWLLVYYKKYATKEEIPNSVSSIMMRRVHDKARVHFSIALMVISAAGMFGSSLLGKYKSHHGQTLNTQQEYMKQYNENKIKEQHLEAPVLEKS